MRMATELPQDIHVSFNFLSGPWKDKVVDIATTPIVMGRKKGDLIIPDTKISGEHARIEFVNGEFILTDLDSTNGVHVNNKRVKEALLEDGTEVRLGLSVFLFRIIRPADDSTDVTQEDDGVETTRKSETPVSSPEVDRSTDAADPIESTVKQEAPAPTGSSTQDRRKLPQVSLSLTVTQGPDEGKQFTLTKGSVLIGRVSVDIKLDDKDVSRKHALIEAFGKDQVYIRDLASTNGTYVNRKRIANCKLSNNDEISVGTTTLRFLID